MDETHNLTQTFTLFKVIKVNVQFISHVKSFDAKVPKNEMEWKC